MKKMQLIGLAVLFIAHTTIAQDTKDERGEKIQAAKVAYITSKLNLNTQQAQQFWPVYNEFETGRKKIRKSQRQLRVDNALLSGTDAEITADIKKMFALRQEELDLEKAYADKFLKVISPAQLADFYRSEKEFTKLLLKRLGGGDGPGRRGRRGPGGGGEMDEPEGR